LLCFQPVVIQELMIVNILLPIKVPLSYELGIYVLNLELSTKNRCETVHTHEARSIWIISVEYVVDDKTLRFDCSYDSLYDFIL
jgi:hypothetical protein